MNQIDQVTIRVPGSTSNCGAGFDSLGLAVSVSNLVTLTRVTAGTKATPERASDARASEMAAEAAAIFFRAVKRPVFGFSYRIEGDVPPARGLGSSVTVRAGIIAALDVLADTGLSRPKIVSLVTELEGHPDNAAASVLGGFCVARSHPLTGAYVDSVRVEIPADLAFVTASPLIQVSTTKSRGTLPATLPYFDAVKSINSAAYFVAAMATGDYDRLAGSVSDFMHEPYRLPGIPGSAAAIAAGIEAGALTGWLSGSGSSVMCVCRREHSEVILAAMRDVFVRLDQACEASVLLADNAGLRLA